MSNKDFSPYERKKKICGRIKIQGLILKYSKMIQKLNFENIIIDEHIYISLDEKIFQKARTIQ